MDRFLEALKSSDDIGVIIRCHYEAERAIDSVIAHKTNDRYLVDRSGFRYLSQKIEVLHLLGVAEIYLSPFTIMNSHRNRFAHRGDEKISKADVDQLVKAVGKVGIKWREDTPVRLNLSESFEGRLKDLPLRQRYVILAMEATMAIATQGQITIRR
ncbi:hypothetical protein ACJ4V0_08830 [Phreatobacter sp. HK31-P]